MAFDADEISSGGPKLPKPDFATIGQGIQIELTQVSDEVTGTSLNDKDVTEVNLVISGVVTAAWGGIAKKFDDELTPIAKGDEVVIWCKYAEIEGGERRRRNKPITTAIAAALKAANVKTATVGGVLTIEHDQLGDKPKVAGHQRAKLYTATYTPPAPVAVGAAAGDRKSVV